MSIHFICRASFIFQIFLLVVVGLFLTIETSSLFVRKIGINGNRQNHHNNFVSAFQSHMKTSSVVVVRNYNRHPQQQQQRRPPLVASMSESSINDDITDKNNNENKNNRGENDKKNNNMMDLGSLDLDAARIRLESLLRASSSSPDDDEDSSTSKKEYVGLNKKKRQLFSKRYNPFSPIMRLFKESNSKEYDDYQLPLPPPITSIERERKETEIRLLNELKYSDHPIEQLWELWRNERGPDAASKLNKIDQLIEQGTDKFDEAQMLLMDLIKEYGIHWAEPSNRLATLHYIRGNLKVSEAVCLTVLAVKPWHFGALTGLTMVYTSLGDTKNANLWRSRRLPLRASTGPNVDREIWVNDAVRKATNKVKEAEFVLKQLFGDQDSHFIKSLAKNNTGIMDYNRIWQ